ncbi:zinc finger MYM-type protein 1-like [Notothenia coriiceps]|uniref:Zinc finger MYM-type protein 1-like n=1 Tax=Notothenia coriiceps TaxID=8208 RepID=A0A6I9PT76_9TELE|nr:PREDICTED: zinc finger MYM-type protein 1-like [Notothenia coriiceps]
MSGDRKGAQARVREMQPLALYVHCGAHCVNLVTQAACKASSLTSDALDWLHKLGCLYKLSGKYKTKFINIATAASGTVSNLQPLCQTRWTTRTPAIWSVLRQYESVLLSLEDMAQTDASNTGVTARGLLERFGKGTTVLGLMLATEVIQELECLNCTLQKQTETVSGMLSAADCVRTTLRAKRTEEKFQEIYSQATEKICMLNIEPISMPHIRRPPKRFIGNNTTAHTPTTPKEHYRADFFKVLDTVDMQLKERFHQSGLIILAKLEEVLLTGELDTTVVDQYPELNQRSLKVQLNMYKLQYPYKSTSEAAAILRSQLPQVRGLFNKVEALTRLLMVVPAASAEA